jgi:alkanesulfonate monooxygenase SsuD/methylene tetrahydromethanopterin reductase-like flavin-dependent oxidoreductase (luciferase family)
MTTVVSVLWRRNPILLAKQVASVDEISGGRLTAALGMGGWPQDYEVSGASQASKGRTWVRQKP